MGKRTNIESESPWEEMVGYSRAVRVGDLLVEIEADAVIQDPVS